jgi:hypothetical protein
MRGVLRRGQDIAPRNGEYLPRLTKPKRRLATTDTIEMSKTNEAWVRCEGGLDPEKKRALPAALRNFVNETGIGHSERDLGDGTLGIRPGTILGWMHGTIELRGVPLIAIKCFLETNRPAYLRADQQDNQADREQTKWHSFLQYLKPLPPSWRPSTCSSPWELMKRKPHRFGLPG